MSRSALRPVNGSVPPNDLDAEAIVLSACLLVQYAFDEAAAILKSDHFYSDANRLVFGAMEWLRENGQAIDVVAVATRLRDTERLERVGGTPYLGQLTDAVPAVANLQQHATTVRAKWQSRRFIETCQRYAAEGYAAPSADELIRNIDTEIGDLASFTAKAELELVHQISDRELAALADAHAHGKRMSGLSTGFTELDRATTGLHSGDVIIIAGRPGMGKTAFVSSLVANIARPKGDVPSEDGTAFFSLEMPREQMALRFLSGEDLIEFGRLRMGTLSGKEWEQVLGTSRRLREWPLWIDDTPALSIFDIRARVRKLKRDIASQRTRVACKRLAVVVVDYLQLMSGTGDNREQEIALITRSLKRLAKEEQVVVLALSQLNRSGEKNSAKPRRPILSDLRESGAIEQDADTVIFVWREELYDKQARKGDAEIIIEKQRNGPLRSLPFAFKAEGTRFYERERATYDEFAADFQDFSPDGD